MGEDDNKSSLAFKIYVVFVSVVTVGLLTQLIPFDLFQNYLHFPVGILVPEGPNYIDLVNAYTVFYFIVSFFLTGLGAAVSIGTRDWFEVLGLFLVGMLPRERKQWGVVSDEQSKQPLAFLPVRIFVEKDGQWVMVAQTSTDSDGRYRLSVKGTAGQRYSLQIVSNGYKPFIHVLENYLTTGSNDIVNDVPLQKQEATGGTRLSNFYLHRARYYRILFLSIYFIYLIVLAVMIFFMINDPLFGNYLSGIIVVVTTVWNTRIVFGRKTPPMGKVLSSPDHKPLVGAEVELILQVGNAKAVSDEQGVVRFMVPGGVYRGNVKMPGFTMLGVDTQGFKIIKIGKEGYASQDIFMQSISTPQEINPRTLLAT